jgi:hypothetical protein
MRVHSYIRTIDILTSMVRTVLDVIDIAQVENLARFGLSKI